jgi:hypothetical protein
MQALLAGKASTVFGTYVWLRANAAAIFPRVIVAYLAKKKVFALWCGVVCHGGSIALILHAQ